MNAPRRIAVDIQDPKLAQRLELSVGKGKRPHLAIASPKRGCLGGELTREDAARLRKWLNDFFARGCEKHGAEGCIECEKRCMWCGVDGDMTKRDGDRVCECCAYSYDQGDFD